MNNVVTALNAMEIKYTIGGGGLFGVLQSLYFWDVLMLKGIQVRGRL